MIRNHPKKMGTNRDTDIVVKEDEMTEENMFSFKLKTASGKFDFQLGSDDDLNYVEIFRTIFGAVISLNSDPDIEPDEIKGRIWEALSSLSPDMADGGMFSSNNETEDDETDDVFSKEFETRKIKQRLEEAQEYVKTLPEAKKYDLVILHADPDDHLKIITLLGKTTDLTNAEINKVIEKKEKITLSSGEAKDLYIQLRTMGVIVAFRSESVHPSKKVAAKKTTVKNKKLKNSNLSAKKLNSGIE